MMTKFTIYLSVVLAAAPIAHASQGDGQPSFIFEPPSRTVRITTPSGSAAQGVFLDDTRILTAAHVVDEHKPDAIFVIDSLTQKGLKATLVNRGQRDQVDLALLSLEKGPPVDGASRKMLRVCINPPTPGDELVVAFENSAMSTHASFDFVSWRNGRELSTATESFFSHGVSGAGVYSPKNSCLMGIISHQETIGTKFGCLKDDVSGKPLEMPCGERIGTKFVEPENIRKFLQ